MIDIDVDFRPALHSVTAMMKRLDRELRNMRAPLERSAYEVLAPSVQANFVAGGRPTWQPLSEATQLQRTELGFDPDQPLIRTGALERATSQRSRWTITNTEARMGNLPASVRYGYLHQSGTEFMPARPFGVVQDDDARDTEKVFGRWVDRTMKTSLAGWR
jgi:phage gpG-like protein